MPVDYPLCSILIVNYNGKKFLDACLRSFEQSNYPQDRFEILVVENGSADGSDQEAQARHSRVRVLHNPRNNFAAALNLGIANSSGSYVVLANNDVFVEEGWLSELVAVMEDDPGVGCAAGKLLLADGRLNSVAHRPLPDFYWDDEGYEEEDHGQYESEREVPGVCWAAVMFRRKCLDAIGPIDEDYVFYYEDVDTSLRCRQLGWKMLYTPKARAVHAFHGSSEGSDFTDYFVHRGRLIYVAKHHPEHLSAAILSSRFVAQSDKESLYDILPIVIKKLTTQHPPQVVERALAELVDALLPIFGGIALDNLLARMQVILGYRRMSIGFYDQALHVIGGGQKYAYTMAAKLQRDFDITLAGSRPVTLQQLETWYHLPLSQCRIRMIPLPFFDRIGAWIDSNLVTPDRPNPFDAVAEASCDFDVFVMVNMIPMVRPLAPFSIFVCHFPDTPRRYYFAVDDYSCLIVNSRYGGEWLQRRWGLQADLLLYPPVDMASKPSEKENIILSASRFEPGGTKKQRELIQAFDSLWTSQPELVRDWQLVLVGGSSPENPYLEELRRLARQKKCPIDIRVNISYSDMQTLYAKAKIFWHACGLGESDPQRVEHFGMTTVEAMQNRCVPIVINGGGQREIVEQGQCGYRFDTLDELCQYTCKVIANPDLMQKLGDAAYQRGLVFSRQRFEQTVTEFFRTLAEEYRTIPVPDPRDILEGKRRTSPFYSAVARRGPQVKAAEQPATDTGTPRPVHLCETSRSFGRTTKSQAASAVPPE